MDRIDVERKLMREKRCMFKRFKNAILDFNAADASVNVNSTAVKAGSAAIVATGAATSMVLANNTGTTSSGSGIRGLFTKFKGFLQQVFEGVDDIITGATVVVIGLGFLIRILSKNQRTVDEATTWIKRAIFTLIAWKFLGLFLTTVKETAGTDGAYKWE